MSEDAADSGQDIHRGDKVTHIPLHGPIRYDAVVTNVREDGHVDLARPMDGGFGDHDLVEVSKVPPKGPARDTGCWAEGWTDGE